MLREIRISIRHLTSSRIGTSRNRWWRKRWMNRINTLVDKMITCISQWNNSIYSSRESIKRLQHLHLLPNKEFEMIDSRWNQHLRSTILGLQVQLQQLRSKTKGQIIWEMSSIRSSRRRNHQFLHQLGRKTISKS